MLGAAQLARFKRAIKRSTATFKVIFNEVPIQQFYALPYDRWEGYEAERQKLLRFLKNNVKNVVFLTTDDHANLVNDARLKTLEPGGPVDSGIMDITTGPIATANYALEIDDAVGGPYAGLIHDLFFKPAPPSGRRHDLRRHGPVLLRRGDGHQGEAEGRAEGARRRRQGARHRRRRRQPRRRPLRALRHPPELNPGCGGRRRAQLPAVPSE